MSYGFYSLGVSFVRKNRLKRFSNISRISVDLANELLKEHDCILIEAQEGPIRTNYFAYVFQLDGLKFYFESSKKIESERVSIFVEKVDVPS